jgi:hypothetical protein
VVTLYSIFVFGKYSCRNLEKVQAILIDIRTGNIPRSLLENAGIFSSKPGLMDPGTIRILDCLNSVKCLTKIREDEYQTGISCYSASEAGCVAVHRISYFLNEELRVNKIIESSYLFGKQIVIL